MWLDYHRASRSFWRFRRGFNFPSRIRSVSRETSVNQRDSPPSRILHFLDSDLFPSAPKTTPAASLAFYALACVRSQIRYNFDGEKTRVDRRMEFDILPDAAWKRAENRAPWHVGNRSNRFLYIPTSPVITRAFWELFFTRVSLRRNASWLSSARSSLGRVVLNKFFWANQTVLKVTRKNNTH